MKKIGFIFLYQDQLRLKPYNDVNKEFYKDKILLTYIDSYQEKKINNNKNVEYGIFLHEKPKRLNISNFLKENYNIQKQEILDYNPIYKKRLDTKNKEITIYSILIYKKNKKNNYKNKNTETISNLNKIYDTKLFFKNSMLLFYNLNSISEENDLFSSIINYYKTQEQLDKYIKQKIFNVYDIDDIDDLDSNNIKMSKFKLLFSISIYAIIESLQGLIELKQETKEYI